ncbi:NADH-quinone oxidoreductase subunit C [Blautia liquoris]|uniref:NADH-quinone oxidoreductase subunit C n=1 Tax=Blautia liquoris TaxID=2779518 RepID=A0A7M2RLJ7_9FIRM|nr:NADH-quinone oxidoreductase subunit C [Blautia liquoris]QOV20417.1 NADH-quinone oxidoreductase subunit C [Blautia liquoris]
MEEQNIRQISAEALLIETNHLRSEGYRLVAVSCTYKDGVELTYSFDKEYDFINLRINMKDDEKIESITRIYPYAFLYENEIKELFGVKITNIVGDFHDKLYRISVDAPFKNKEEE